MREYSGDFEAHLTVAVENPSGLEVFRKWCEQRQLKCVRIVLSRGEHVEQPMATWRRGDSVCSTMLEECRTFAAEAADCGLEVVRLKIETAPDNDEVPITDGDAAEHATDNYFEHHVKLRRPTDASRSALEQICDRLGAHLSKNACRRAADGHEERFVTLRA